MSSPNQLAVYTVPSTWVNSSCSSMKRPYLRVVGVETGGGTLWVTSSADYDPNGNYSQGDADKLLIPANPMLTERFIGFVARYHLRQSPSYLDANCHRFGRWMRGAVAAGTNAGLLAPNEVVTDGFKLKTGTRLPVNKTGVVGYKLGGVGIATHTLVGLGPTTDNTLNQIADGGHLGLLPYDHAEEYYAQSLEPVVQAGAGIYV